MSDHASGPRAFADRSKIPQGLRLVAAPMHGMLFGSAGKVVVT